MLEENGNAKTKQCTNCKITKLLNSSNFPPHNKTKSGFCSWCRECRSTYRSSISRGKFRSSIDDETLKNLKKNTKFCMICGNEPQVMRCGKKLVKTLCVDHCHKTLKFRGLLCFNCNLGLGKFQDSIKILENAIIYLKNC